MVDGGNVELPMITLLSSSSSFAPFEFSTDGINVELTSFSLIVDSPESKNQLKNRIIILFHFVLLFKLVRLSPIYKTKSFSMNSKRQTITYDYYFHSKLSLVVLVLDLHMNLLSFELLLKKPKFKFILIISFFLRIASTFAFGIT